VSTMCLERLSTMCLDRTHLQLTVLLSFVGD